MKCIYRALFVIIGFFAALFIFFPYDSAAEYAASVIEMNAAKNGIYISMSDITSNGIFSKTFSCGKVKAELPMAVIECRNAQISMSVSSVLLADSKKIKISTGKGSVTLMTRQKAEWIAGSASLKTDGARLLIDDVAFTGTTSLLGSAEISVPDKNITRANLLIKNPEELDRAFNMASQANILPLRKVKNGEWRLEK